MLAYGQMKAAINEDDLTSSDLFQKWLALASDDLKMAEFALKESLWLPCAFHVQQSIEKSFKGLIVKFGTEEPPYTHDLVRLLDLAVVISPELETYRKTLSSINPFYIRARYPSYKEKVASTLDTVVLKSFLKTAREIMKWCETKKT